MLKIHELYRSLSNFEFISYTRNDMTKIHVLAVQSELQLNTVGEIV